MIRLINRRLIIPRGDTGSFSLPLKYEGDLAVFSIFDPQIKENVLNIKIDLSNEEKNIVIPILRNDTINLLPKKYLWDIKIYKNPKYNEDELVINGDEINSYYSAFSLPVCEIKEIAEKILS